MTSTAGRATLCVALGFVLFFCGFRLTSEVIPVLWLTMLAAGVVGFTMRDRPWLWGPCIAIGTRIGRAFEPALTADHVRKEGPSQSLPLPFGLTENVFAQHVAGSLLIMAFPFVATIIGWGVRKLWSLASGRDKVRRRISAL
jgi:hypothetical protein